MQFEPLILPSLRGSFGSWTYYTCLVPINEVGARVRFADEVHPNKALSQLIQRTLQGPRAKKIAQYLAENEERFFNSMVVATYGGSPEWLEIGNFRSAKNNELAKKVAREAMDTVGFLSFSGEEKLFAVDGQHRLAGIKVAIENDTDLSEDLVPVIFVGHRKTAAGLQRTRRLFTTLNKTVVAVKKSDIIALDEDDAMAIVARQLVETDERFKSPKIAVISSHSIPPTDHQCLTTIITLYDILKMLFMHESKARSDQKLRFNRPTDERLLHLKNYALDYFDALSETFPPVRQLFLSGQPSTVASKYRSAKGGHILFRTIGLNMFTRIAIELATVDGVTLREALKMMKALPTDISKAPYRDVVWNSSNGNMRVLNKTVARDALRYMIGLIDEDDVLDRYRASLDRPNDKKIKLPKRVA